MLGILYKKIYSANKSYTVKDIRYKCDIPHYTTNRFLRYMMLFNNSTGGYFVNNIYSETNFTSLLNMSGDKLIVEYWESDELIQETIYFKLYKSNTDIEVWCDADLHDRNLIKNVLKRALAIKYREV